MCWRAVSDAGAGEVTTLMYYAVREWKSNYTRNYMPLENAVANLQLHGVDRLLCCSRPAIRQALVQGAQTLHTKLAEFYVLGAGE